MLAQPGRQRGRRPIRQQVDDPMLLQINEDRAVLDPFGPGPVVHTQHTDEPGRRQWRGPYQAQQRTSTDWRGLCMGATRSGITTERKSLIPKVPVQTGGPPCPRCCEVRQTFAEDTTSTPGDATPVATRLHV